jgi:hypothetical protein
MTEITLRHVYRAISDVAAGVRDLRAYVLASKNGDASSCTPGPPPRPDDLERLAADSRNQLQVASLIETISSQGVRLEKALGRIAELERRVKTLERGGDGTAPAP